MTKLMILGPPERRGSAAVVALVAVTVLVGLCGAMLMIASRSSSEGGSAVDRHQATAVAQSGMSEALQRIAAGNADVATDAPLELGGGTYSIEVEEGNEQLIVRSTANVRGEQEVLEALLTGGGLDIYDHALFAGNKLGDPLYKLKLGGKGTQADLVKGDVYSGGGVAVTGNASVTGTIRATGAITGASGETAVVQPIPDIDAMNYPTTADFKVADLFKGATYKSSELGGKAYQVAESNPASIFRKNPSDRTSDTGSTVKDDYFLEDPYEPMTTDSGSTGANACKITLSGVSGEPGADSNHQVFFIDGNLWVHNMNVFSFKIDHSEPNGVQVTFVARGNIY